MCEMEGITKFSIGTYNYEMQWHLRQEDCPAVYELVVQNKRERV